MDEYKKQCEAYVQSGEWIDFIKIFSDQPRTFEQVNSDCIKLGRGYPTWLGVTAKKVLFLLPELIKEYKLGLSSVELSDKYSLPRTTLQTYLGALGVLRDRKQAFEQAIKKGISFLYSHQLIKYNDQGQQILFHSSWELAYYQQVIKEQGVHMKRETERIPYYDQDGLLRTYIPDFKLELPDKVVIIEVKPRNQLVGVNLLKCEAAITYCNQKSWDFLVITESDIDWDHFPDYNDENIIMPHELTHQEIVEQRRTDGYDYCNIDYDEHFITKSRAGDWKFSYHPRANTSVTYEVIMEYLRSQPPYSVSIYDIYSMFHIDRNALIRRLRDDAEGRDKDITYWELKYLSYNVRERCINSKQYQCIFELQESGVRDFGLPNLLSITNYLTDLNRSVFESDIQTYLGFGQNKTRKYIYELGASINEIIEQINNKIR